MTHYLGADGGGGPCLASPSLPRSPRVGAPLLGSVSRGCLAPGTERRRLFLSGPLFWRRVEGQAMRLSWVGRSSPICCSAPTDRTSDTQTIWRNGSLSTTRVENVPTPRPAGRCNWYGRRNLPAAKRPWRQN